MSAHTPTADELMNNTDWVALHGDMHPSHLKMIADDQAERAARYFLDIAKAEGGAA